LHFKPCVKFANFNGFTVFPDEKSRSQGHFGYQSAYSFVNIFYITAYYKPLNIHYFEGHFCNLLLNTAEINPPDIHNVYTRAGWQEGRGMDVL